MQTNNRSLESGRRITRKQAGGSRTFLDRAASRRVREFLRVVTANNRTRGERADRNHLGIPFNRAASETNCGLTVYPVAAGTKRATAGGESEYRSGWDGKSRGRQARGVDSRPRLRFK